MEKALSASEHKLNGKSLKISRRELKEFVCKSAGAAASGQIEKKELVEKLKQEALSVNTIWGKCESVSCCCCFFFKLTFFLRNKIIINMISWMIKWTS